MEAGCESGAIKVMMTSSNLNYAVERWQL